MEAIITFTYIDNLEAIWRNYNTIRDGQFEDFLTNPSKWSEYTKKDSKENHSYWLKFERHNSYKKELTRYEEELMQYKKRTDAIQIIEMYSNDTICIVYSAIS